MKGNVRSNTKPELRLRGLLREAGYPGYRLHWKQAPGTPDIAYPGRRVAIFVNGCFWHRCPHCTPPSPKSHSEFWSAKFQRNQERDARKQRQLEAAGWSVVTVWECELRSRPMDTLSRVISVLSRPESPQSEPGQSEAR
jgi:DNA mismatch endonuclease (patch repair protein)